MVKLTEVVRSTKRIVAGTAAFLAAALEREGITSFVHSWSSFEDLPFYGRTKKTNMMQ